MPVAAWIRPLAAGAIGLPDLALEVEGGPAPPREPVFEAGEGGVGGEQAPSGGHREEKTSSRAA